MCLDDAIVPYQCTVCTWRGPLYQAKRSVILGPDIIKCPACGSEIIEASQPPVLSVVYEAEDGAVSETSVPLASPRLGKKPEPEQQP